MGEKIRSDMLFGTPMLIGDNTIPGVKMPEKLEKLIPEIINACTEFGIEPYPPAIHLLTYDQISEIAAYGGFPVRYPHWQFGMSYEELSRGYEHGRQKIFELVINSSPTQLYCLDSNPLVDHVTVIAHALFHSDFFKNNIWFKPTTTNSVNEMANHGVRIKRYMDRHGEEKVIKFIDWVLSIDELVDPAVAWKNRKIKQQTIQDTKKSYYPRKLKIPGGNDTQHEYMNEWINDEKWRNKESQRIKEREIKDELHIMEHPDKNILGFLCEHAPLNEWQKDIIAMLYREALYFAPQAMTKMANEGWACLKSGLIFTNEGILQIEDIVNNQKSLNIHDGDKHQEVFNWFIFDRPTIKVKTRRGLEMEGSFTHRVWDSNKEWKRLDELHVGDKLKIVADMQIWADAYVELDLIPEYEEINNELHTYNDFDNISTKNCIEVDAKVKCKPQRIVDERYAEYLATQQLDSIPDCILRSPRSVMSAFLRKCYDDNGYVGKGVIFSTTNELLGQQIQQILLNYGILTYRDKNESYWNIITVGLSAIRFRDQIGFSLSRKMKQLDDYIKNHKWFKEEEDYDDEIVEIKVDNTLSKVYDLSVEDTHRYASLGFMHHNSYGDYNIMARKHWAGHEGIVHYARHKMAVLGGKDSLNPYAVGFKLFLYIEDKWNKGRFGREYEECDDANKKAKWDLKLGLGHQKVFEVRQFHNDITMIQEFVDQEFVDKMQLFIWKKIPNNEGGHDYVIDSRNVKDVKRLLLNSYLNAGRPDVRLVDNNFGNQGILFMQHRWDGRILDRNKSQHTLVAMWNIWNNGGMASKRPIALASRDKEEREIVFVCTGGKPDQSVVMDRKTFEETFTR